MVAPDGSFDVNTGETVNIADLVVVQAARSTVSSEHVQVLAGAPTELPPILVHRSTMQVVDGYHRVQAALLNGATKIRARFFDGSEAEAFVEAVRQNVAHGLPLSLADRKTAAARLIASHPSYSNRAIARTTGLSDGTVRSLRTFETVDGGDGACRGLDGRVRPSTTAEGRIRAHKLIQSNPDVPLRTVANRAGISLGTAHDVRKRLQRGDDPVPPHQRQRHATVSTRSPSPAPPEAERIESAGDRSPGGPPPGAARSEPPSALTCRPHRLPPSARHRRSWRRCTAIRHCVSTNMAVVCCAGSCTGRCPTRNGARSCPTYRCTRPGQWPRSPGARHSHGRSSPARSNALTGKAADTLGWPPPQAVASRVLLRESR